MQPKIKRTEIKIETHEIRIIRSALWQTAPAVYPNPDLEFDIGLVGNSDADQVGSIKREILIKGNENEN